MNLHGKTILVTGSTDGIGKQTALILAEKGARVLIHGRSEQKVQDTIHAIKERTPAADLAGYVADYSSLQKVRDLTMELKAKEERLDILINNAGIYTSDYQLSEDGFELTFAVNQLAPFLLTLSLLDKIRASSPARIINVTSIAHNVRELNIAMIHAEEAFQGWRAYKLSKFAIIVFTYELSRRVANDGITVNCLHPGAVNTKILNSAFPDMQGISLAEGARSSVLLATSDELADTTGEYFENGQIARSAPLTLDEDIQKRMWAQCEEWVAEKSKKSS